MLSKKRCRVTEGQVRTWFADRLTYFTTKRLLEVLEDPDRMFNFDESNIIFSPTVAWVLVIRGLRSTKDAFTDTPGMTEKGSVTALIMASASGNFPPPMLIMKGAGPDPWSFPV